MKRALRWMTAVVILLCYLPNSAKAQVPDYTIAQDFTFSDINGVEHNLYTYLDQGKSVILDISATWCPPCWSYHQTHVLNDVYNQYGPNGTDEIMVFLIEGDGSTGMADLQGTTSGTLGNWIAGTDYPIIDEASLSNTFDILGFPTLFVICPNRVVRETGRYSNAAGHRERILELACQTGGGVNNAGILEYQGTEGAFCNNLAFSPKVRVQNLGSETMTSATINVTNNGDVSESINWTGNLVPYAQEVVTLGEFSTDVDAEMVIDIADVNGMTDDILTNNSITKSHDVSPSTGHVINIEIRTDNYGCETKWDLVNTDNNTIVATGGNPDVIPGSGGNCIGTGYASNSTYNESVGIPATGCYEFRLYDHFGDGLCCTYGDGYVKLTDAAGNLFLESNSFAGTMLMPLSGISLLTTDQQLFEVCTNEAFTFEVLIGDAFTNAANLTPGGEGVLTLSNDSNLNSGESVQVTVEGFPTPGTYTISIGANDGIIDGTVTYQVVVVAAPVTSLNLPQDGAEDLQVNPVLLWQNIEEATSFEVQIASDLEFIDIVYTAQTGSYFHTVQTPLAGSTQYYWRILSNSDCGAGPSEPRGFTTEETTSVGELQGSTIDIQPNPTSGIVNVLVTGRPLNNVQVQIFSIGGQLMQTQRFETTPSNIDLDLSAYSNGIYLIKLINAEKSLTSKVILNK